MTAISVLAVMNHQRSRRQSTSDNIPFELSARLPTERKRDILLGTLLNAEWQKRRIVYSKSKICFALPGDDQVRDHIPMEEVTAVEIMHEEKEFEELISAVREARSRESTHQKIDSRSEDADSSLNFLFLHVFQIRTKEHGFNSGRTYYLQAESKEMCNQITLDLQKLAEAARSAAEGLNRFKKSQEILKRIYKSIPFQVISAILILANFALCIAEAQRNFVSAPDAREDNYFSEMEVLLVCLFSFELLINAYAHWYESFIQNRWNLFDVLLICTSLVGLAPLGLPLNLMLILRSIRLLRAFGKVKAINKILAALLHSLLPMGNAFFIILTIASIYAIIGVTFYYDDAPEQFSDFNRAFIAMFCITLGSIDWWFETFPAVTPDGSVNFWSSFFLITYVISVNWVLFQVSIAVLLDSFLAANNAFRLEEEADRIREKQFEKQLKNPLDPLLLRLSKDYINDADLSCRLQELFKVLDTDESGDLSSQEFQAELKKLDLTPQIFMSDSDFIALTHDGALCDPNGRLRAKEFEVMMREQLRLYAQARLSSTSEFWAVQDSEFAPIGALKQILIEQLRLRSEQDAMRVEMLDTFKRVLSPGNNLSAEKRNFKFGCESLNKQEGEFFSDASYIHSDPPQFPLQETLLEAIRKCIHDELSTILHSTAEAKFEPVSSCNVHVRSMGQIAPMKVEVAQSSSVPFLHRQDLHKHSSLIPVQVLPARQEALQASDNVISKMRAMNVAADSANPSSRHTEEENPFTQRLSDHFGHINLSSYEECCTPESDKSSEIRAAASTDSKNVHEPASEDHIQLGTVHVDFGPDKLRCRCGLRQVFDQGTRIASNKPSATNENTGLINPQARLSEEQMLLHLASSVGQGRNTATSSPSETDVRPSATRKAVSWLPGQK